MSQSTEYAQMLEIPVSTVNVVKKRTRFQGVKSFLRSFSPKSVKSVPLPADRGNFAGVEGIEETPLPLAEEEKEEVKDLFEEQSPLGQEPLEQEAAKPMEKRGRIARGVLLAEGGVACALCVGIFITNLLMPSSAINVFLRNVTGGTTAQTAKTYADFELTPVVSDNARVTTALSSDGVLTFTGACALYPACEGTVSEIAQGENGYTVTLAHTDLFKSVYTGVTTVYYQTGEKVLSNVPFAYTDGTAQVSVSFYEDGVALNCYSVDSQNCLSWNK